MTTSIELPEPEAMTFAKDGALRIRAVHDASDLRRLEDAVANLPPDQAGSQASRNSCASAVSRITRRDLEGGRLGPRRSRPAGQGHPLRQDVIRTNWGLPWHQDRTIVVTRRVEVAGFGPWTVKSGLLHVAPPFDLLAGMVTLRVHLDPVPETNAPLLIAPGSHRLGQLPEGEVKSVVRRCGSVTCLADAGDVWLYSTPILHCSEAARDPAHRRVLQVDFAAGDLPGGLTWLGV